MFIILPSVSQKNYTSKNQGFNTLKRAFSRLIFFNTYCLTFLESWPLNPPVCQNERKFYIDPQTRFYLSMIYQFKITSIEKPDFSLTVDLDGKHTFADFHECIQQACRYSPDQLASFFLAGKNWGKQIEITQLDMGFAGLASKIMSKTHLEDLLYSEQQRLLYVFDFFYDRSFYIELTHISMGKNLFEPTVTSYEGDAPAQILEEDLQEQGTEILQQEDRLDYGDLDDYTEIFGEMEDLTEGL